MYSQGKNGLKPKKQSMLSFFIHAFILSLFKADKGSLLNHKIRRLITEPGELNITSTAFRKKNYVCSCFD